jgi:hypothetical protein
MRQFGERGHEVASDCREQLETALSEVSGRVLVLSTERVAGLNDTDMQTLRSLLEPHCSRLRVVAYVRSPESALEAILQERIKAGAIIEPESVVGRVRKRCEALQTTFPDLLEIYCYEQQVKKPGGVVSDFLHLLGVKQPEITTADIPRDNPRMSLESFRLANAVNRRYPKRMQGHHGVKREPQDLCRLLELPGQPFHIPNFAGSPLHSAALEEAAWLEDMYGLRFPAVQRPDHSPLWQKATTDDLPQGIDSVDNPDLKACVAEFLLVEAASIRTAQPAEAATLEQIAQATKTSA